MTFEEFFKKKKIDLLAFEKAEPALFSEFKTHYEQMGEKSFDHTKKYWFNKIRRRFHLAPEVKAEKPLIENRVAEQTITESLTETAAPAPPPAKLGFVPKFKAGNMAKPAVNADDKKDVRESLPLTENTSKEQPVESTEAKPGYVPRFKMKPKAAIEESKPENNETPPPPENTEAKPAYKPRFNMKNLPPKEKE